MNYFVRMTDISVLKMDFSYPTPSIVNSYMNVFYLHFKSLKYL